MSMVTIHGVPFVFSHHLASFLYQVDDPEIKQDLRSLVKPSIDFMLSQRFPSGNCPSTLGSSTDKLIHWCHGAPGWIYMFLSGYKVNLHVLLLNIHRENHNEFTINTTNSQ